MRSYCIFCKSGSEQTVADTINSLHKGLLAIAPQKIIQEKRNRIWEKRSLALLPGYVFLYSEDGLDARQSRVRVTDMYKILQYDGGFKELLYEDSEYSMWIYNNQGNITPSRILSDGEAVQVIDGPLLNCLGRIIRLDKHKRRALVEFNFDGQKRIVSLGADIIESRKESAS